MAELNVNGSSGGDANDDGDAETATSLDSSTGGGGGSGGSSAATAAASAPPPDRANQILSAAGLTGRQDNTLDHVRQWSVSTYKCTKQLVSERLGKGSRTVDTDLEAAVANLRDSQKRYQALLNLAGGLARHFQFLAKPFRDLARSDRDLSNEFGYNCETQRALAANGERLMSALNFFCQSLNTLVTKTFEDTLITVNNYEYASLTPTAPIWRRPTQAAAAALNWTNCAQNSKPNEPNKRLRQDVRVMQKQLLLFHNAVSAYFSGNQTALEATLKQFSVRPMSGSSERQAFLEQPGPQQKQKQQQEQKRP
uniref:AH domain-containing protein n=1 Tax=Macrostomum lignano TaxID=282301 RepID=A0A1I8F637_9PLAT